MQVNDFLKNPHFILFICGQTFSIMSKSSSVNTAHQQIRMLRALETYFGNVAKATRAVGITRQTHYNWYNEDDDYADKVNIIKYECHEDFKNLVMDSVRKKIEQGNTAIIALCYKNLFMGDARERLDVRSPIKFRPLAAIKLVDRQSVLYSKDPDTARILSEVKEEGSNPRQKLDPFSPEGMAAYEAVLQRQREGKKG